MKNKRLYLFINGITLYRLIAAPILIILVIAGKPDLFKWLLLISFLTDAVDGFFARKYKITSAFGARIDSLADDGTILAAIVGLCVLRAQFILDEIVPLSILFLLYAAQNILALSKYKRTTSFHTYAAKTAAVSQAIFLITFFFISHPVYWLFFLMVALTSIDLLEEIILVVVLPDYRINVKGLYWILTKKAGKQDSVG